MTPTVTTTYPLQPGSGPIHTDHYLPSRVEEIRWGWLPNAAAPPVLQMASGTTVTIDTVSHEGLLEDQGRDPIPYLAQYGVPQHGVLEDVVEIAASSISHEFNDGPHVVTGPIHVEGARPGDLLRVDILDLEPRVPYGFISSRHGYGALPGEHPEPDALRDPRDTITSMGSISYFCHVEGEGSSARGVLTTAGGRTVPFALAPFLGLTGVAASTHEPVGSVPPGRHGGNMDIKHAVVGTSLYLPVQTPGAGFYAGDPHFAQGNGEVALTALEASLRATLRLTVVPAADRGLVLGTIDEPFLETPTHWIPTGMDVDLDVATQRAVRNAVDFLSSHVGLPRSAALAYLSAAGDLEVSQVVDAVKGVHCLIRKADFAGWV